MKRTNLVCSIVTQSWCRIFVLVGFNATLRRKELRRERRKVCKLSCRQIRNQVRLLQIIPWHLFELVKTCVGLTTSQPHADQKPTELQRTLLAGSKKVHLHFCFSQVDCVWFLWNYKTNWQTESHFWKKSWHSNWWSNNTIWSRSFWSRNWFLFQSGLFHAVWRSFFTLFSVKTTPHKTVFAVWNYTRNSRTGQKLN